MPSKTLAATRLVALLIAGAPASALAQAKLCADPGGYCGRKVSAECLSKLGAGAVSVESASAGCRDQLAAYRDCVSDAAAQCGAIQAGVDATGRCGATQEKELWAIAAEDADCGGYQAFLEVCPSSARAAFARSRLEKLGCGVETATIPKLNQLADQLPATVPDDLSDGFARAYDAPYDTVLAAVADSLAQLDLEIESREESAFGALLYFKKSISLWSWGEKGRVAVLRPSAGAVRVVVTSRKRMPTQVTGASTEAFAKQIFAELSTRLSAR